MKRVNKKTVEMVLLGFVIGMIAGLWPTETEMLNAREGMRLEASWTSIQFLDY